MKVKQRCRGTKEKGLTFGILLQVLLFRTCRLSIRRTQADLDEHRQAVVSIAGRVQVVLVLLCDVWHKHVHERLYCMVERHREALVPGELESK